MRPLPDQMDAMDAVQTGMLHSIWPPLLLAALWVIAAGLVPMLRVHRRRAAIMALTVAGVPVLGWLTYCCGPAVGLLGFALGLAMLLTQPLARRTA